MLEEFVKLTIMPYLLVGGLITTVTIIFAFAPQKAVMRSLKLDWHEEYSPVVRHWGFMVLLVGIFLIWAAFDRTVLFPAMVLSTVEKAFMVFLFFSNVKKDWIRGYRPMGVIDTIMVIYALLYFAVLIGKNSTALF